MAPRDKVTLPKQDRGLLEAMTRSGRTAAAKSVHARALVPSDNGEVPAPITASRGHGCVIDHECIRRGVAEIFVEAALPGIPKVPRGCYS